MPSLRCTLCAISWPADEELYNPCPSCEDATFPIGNRRSEMSAAEALSMKLHFDFDRFYESWDARKPSKRLRPTADDRVRFPFDLELAEKRT